MKIKVSNVNTPNWKDVNVKSHIPAELEKLSELAHNIWWAWNYEATELFRDLDPALWKEVGQNPVLLLERMSYAKLEALANDKVILRRMDDVYSKFRTYMDVKPDSKRPSVAYFSMEYGLSHVLKIYSGGLGVLAGDYLKEASDSNADLCAIGFLYRYGYFTQTLSMDGQQIANYACQFIGNPYVPGGTSLTEGADCSGFVWRVYKDFGYSVPRTSGSLRNAGTEVSYANAQPGDIMCYAGHVGIYIGNGQIVHASTQRTGIKITAATYREILAVRRIV